MKALSLFFLLFLIAEYAHSQQVICFLNKTGRKVLIQKRTILEEGAYPYTIDTSAESFQCIPLLISRSTILNVTTIPPKGPYGSADGLYFLFKPGDSLVITLNHLQKPVIEHLTNVQRTKELSFFQSHLAKLKIILPYQLFGFNKDQFISRKIWSDNLIMRDKILDSLYRPYIHSTKGFFSDFETLSDADKWSYFYFGNLIADKLFVGQKIDKQLQSRLNSFYADSLSKWQQELNCKECENIPSYNAALYATYRQRFSELIPRHFIDTVSALEKGSNKDFILSRYINENANEVGNDEHLLRLYENACTDPVYRNKVIENYTRHSKQRASFTNEAAILIKADKSEVGFTQLINQLKGRVVYVDFWASWCKPCINELPYSHQLKEKVKNKDIEFLYISIDDDFNSWKEAVAKYKIPVVNSFMMPAADKTALAKKIELGPIPRYLIIDKSGKIVSLNAPRPSEEETIGLLIKTLNTND